jgi:hypothetical protein
MKRGLLAVLCVLAAGCSTRGQVDPDTMQIATAPLTCENEAQCDLWWKRAQAWVTRVSTYEVRTVSDTLIQTAGPDGGKRALAYQITLTPDSDGTATIGFAAHCDSSFGCKPNPWEAGADFKQYVRSNAAGGTRQSPSSAPSEANPSDTAGAQSARPSSTGESISQ